MRDTLGRLLAHCARAAPFVGHYGAATCRSSEGWWRVDDVEDTSRLFSAAWEARAAAAMLAWYVDTEGAAADPDAARETGPGPVSEEVLDDVLRVLGVTEDGGEPCPPAGQTLPVRAMMSLRRRAAAGEGVHLNPSLRRNLMLDDDHE